VDSGDQKIGPFRELLYCEYDLGLCFCGAFLDTEDTDYFQHSCQGNVKIVLTAINLFTLQLQCLAYK
jgi:hypothetical protein